jgi:DNA-binding MarR family transcriptional regulator
MGQKVNHSEFYDLWVLIAQTKDAMSEARHKTIQKYTTNERRAVLSSIQYHGGEATPTQISRYLIRKLNSVSEILKRMESEGLIKKSCGENKRRVLVKLTRKGCKLFEQSFDNEIDKEMLSVLNKKERENLASYLKELRRQAFVELGLPISKIPFSSQPLSYSPSKKAIKHKPAKAK